MDNKRNSGGIRHKTIKEMNLEEVIKHEFFSLNKSINTIANEQGIPFSSVQRFIREEKIKNYNDNKLEAVARSSDYNALSLVDTFFDSANFASKELAMTAIIAQVLREEVAEIMASQGVRGLLEEENRELVSLWFKNTEKLSKLSANVPKYLDTYVNMFTQILDVQRQVSYVKVVTDELRKADPVLHKKIFDALNKDTAAKAVMGSISSADIVEYWAGQNSTAGRANIHAKGAQDEDSDT